MMSKREKRPQPRVFVYEYLTGGGLFERESPQGVASLLAEGRAMRDALAGDLAAAGANVVCLHDARQDNMPPGAPYVAVRDATERDMAFDGIAATIDRTIVIAPEIGGALGSRCQRVVSIGGRLLGGSLPLIALASDKNATAKHLAKAGVPVPHGMAWSPEQPWPQDLRYPAVFKPLDGAGSQGIHLLPSAAARHGMVKSYRGRLEEFCPGVAASVALICGPGGLIGLPPCRQRLSNDGRFCYLGGSFDLPSAMADRAVALARRAVATLPEPLGYVGVDLVLGDSDDGRDDFVIEINPRLTTSYIGLRIACRENIAAAMLAIADGDSYDLSFATDSVQFSADGRVGIAHHHS